MRGIFWNPDPDNSYKLIDLVRNFDERPIIYGWHGHWEDDDSASMVEWLVEQSELVLGGEFFRKWVHGNFDLSYRPSFIRQSIFKDDVDTGDEIVQAMDWKSILFFLADWESSHPAIIFSGDGVLNNIATAFASHYGYRRLTNPKPDFIVEGYPTKYPEDLVSDFTERSRFVIFTETVNGTVIVSHDDALLHSMFDYLVSSGEPGFVYDGTTESRERRRQMVSGGPGGLYIDEVPAGFARWRDETRKGPL